MTPQPKPAEPAHASLWPNIRKACTRLAGKDCVYPFCTCIVPVKEK